MFHGDHFLGLLKMCSAFHFEKNSSLKKTKQNKKIGKKEEEKNSIFVGRGGEVDIVLMQPPWHRIPDFWDHPSLRIQCKQSSKDAGEEATREDIFEGICQRVEDSPMSGINIQNILLRSIYCPVHLKIIH
jgi:hypothetical protein